MLLILLHYVWNEWKIEERRGREGVTKRRKGWERENNAWVPLKTFPRASEKKMSRGRKKSRKPSSPLVNRFSITNPINGPAIAAHA